MEKNLLRAFIILLFAGFFHACNDNLIEETVPVDPVLKSAQSNKISYIVVLNDAELNAELSNLKVYELRQQAAKKAAEEVISRAAVTDAEMGFIYNAALKGFSVKIPPGQLKKLENDPSVLRVTEDQIITLIEPDALSSKGDFQASAQTLPWGISRVGGGSNYTGSNVAWIIDTGIDLDHPDLKVDPSKSAWFVSRVSSANDDNGHGTHVAGTVAALNNGIGVIGVAAGATVIPVKVLDRRGSGSLSGVIKGVDWVAGNGKAGDVANMSLGGSYYEDLNTAVKNAAAKGIKFSLAAGNEGTHANTKSPASADGSNIYTISAMAEGDLWASYSNYGNPPVDYCAPGSGVYSTYKDGSYATASGTSMAAPHVAGILLLGSIKTDGYVKNDPDGNPDPIASAGSATPVAVGNLSGSVISGAKIVIEGTSFSAIAENNAYTISNIPTGNYNVTASKSGYLSETATGVSITEGKTTTQDFNLQEVPTSSVSGLVTGDNSEAIYNALVTIEGTNLSGYTDETGFYSISGVAQGGYQITASAQGFADVTQDISVLTSNITVNFSLKPMSTSSIILTASGYKVKGQQKANLSWTGASAPVTIYRNNTVVATNVSDTSYTDNINQVGGGTYVYKVYDGTSESNEATVTFN
jgi:hypothetical protein